jgi:hypothetical protein
MRHKLRYLALAALFPLFIGNTAGAANMCSRGTEFFASAYHSSIVANDTDLWAFGQTINADGSNNNYTPVALTPGNNYTYNGDILMATDATHDTQAFLLTTEGLYTWGSAADNTQTTDYDGTVIYDTDVSFHEIDMPAGVSPSDVEYMTASDDVLALLAGGKVYTKGVGDEILGHGGSAADANGWYTVKKADGSELTGVRLLRVHQQGAFAVTDDNEYYTWGPRTFLGDGSGKTSRDAATQMTAPFAGTPSMIAVTGYLNSSETNYGTSYYVLNPDDTKIYVLGGNRYGQLGINSTVDQTNWTKVRNTDDTGDLTGVITINAQDNSNHYPTAGAIVNGFVSGNNTYDHVLLLWGSDNYSMIGGGNDGDELLPIVPAGFTPGQSYAARFELGGHTSMYYDPNYTDSNNHTGKMCYVGHKTAGSMGDGTGSGEESSFN